MNNLAFETKIIESNENKLKDNIIPSFNKFIEEREPLFNLGLKPNMIRNMTSKENQINKSIDLLNKTDYINITKYNKISNLENENNLVNDNKIDNNEKIYTEKIQGIRRPYIPYDEYNNPSSYFNNFNNQGRMEILKEYICHISSIDRDIKKYPNVFNFLIKFRPTSEETDANIGKIFNNIKSIKIENLVLPRKYYLNKKEITTDETIINLFNNLPNTNDIINNYVIIYSLDDSENNKQIINYTNIQNDISLDNNISYECIRSISNNTYITYEYIINNKSLEEDRYILIYMNDIKNISENSTNKDLSTAFNVLYPDIITKSYLYIDGHNVEKIYEYSNLGNMNRLLINLKSSIGKDLTTNIKAQDYNVPNINLTKCICEYDEYNNIKRNYTCLCNYIRHPRYCKNQIDIMLRFNVIEANFDKRALD